MGRIAWIDAARGIGIMAVVYGHVFFNDVKDWIYLWHMPLFFFLSGYVFKKDRSVASYASKRARQLIVPYFSWMLVVMLPNIVTEVRHHDLAALKYRAYVAAWGGTALAGPTTAYWFLTALFLALIAYDGISLMPEVWSLALCLTAYALACARSFFLPGLSFPLAADAALLAIPFIHAGYLARSKDWSSKKILIIGSVVSVAALGAMLLHFHVPTYDFKHGFFGVPGLNFALALCGICPVIIAAQSAGILEPALAYIGRASLVVMLLHTAILVFMMQRGLNNHTFTAYVLALGLPIAAYALVSRFQWTRTVFLGHGPVVAQVSKRIVA